LLACCSSRSSSCLCGSASIFQSLDFWSLPAMSAESALNGFLEKEKKERAFGSAFDSAQSRALRAACTRLEARRRWLRALTFEARRRWSRALIITDFWEFFHCTAYLHREGERRGHQRHQQPRSVAVVTYPAQRFSTTTSLATWPISPLDTLCAGE
jgi:hypothetical protein